MSAPLHDWPRELRQLSQKFTTAFGHLTEVELNVKPSPEQWSIGQNIDHLITINETYFPVIEQLRTGTLKLSWVARIPFLVRLFGNEIYKASKADRRKKNQDLPTLGTWPKFHPWRHSDTIYQSAGTIN
ncbi:MAG: DinB family protein [Bacteroidota bacterium]